MAPNGKTQKRRSDPSNPTKVCVEEPKVKSASKIKHRKIFQDNIFGFVRPQILRIFRAASDETKQENRLSVKVIQTIREEDFSSTKIVLGKILKSHPKKLLISNIPSGYLTMENIGGLKILPMRRVLLEASQDFVDTHPIIEKGFIEAYIGLINAYIYNAVKYSWEMQKAEGIKLKTLNKWYVVEPVKRSPKAGRL